LTLKEFDALCKRKKINDRRIETYSAQISYLLYNSNRGDNSPVLKLEDFMLKDVVEKTKSQSVEEMKRIAKSITRVFNGDIK
jgi:hypothetical protein